MLSYPFLFAVDRGNLDLLLLNLVFLWWVLRARGHDVAASMCIGFVGAAKLVPLLLLLPDLVNLRIRRVFLPAAFAVAFTGLGLIAIGEPIERSLQLLSRNHETWNRLWILKGQCIPYSHNLLSAVKTLALAYCLKSHIPVQPIHEFSFQYYKVIQYAGIPLMIFAGWRLRHEQEWKIIFVAVAAMLLLPPVSLDYKLLYIFLPLILFINEPPEVNDRKFSILFGLLLIPKAYWFLFSLVSISVILTPILICLMLWILLKRDPVACSVSPAPDL
jgi:hypothetical protein